MLQRLLKGFAAMTQRLPKMHAARIAAKTSCPKGLLQGLLQGHSGCPQPKKLPTAQKACCKD
jgi:hypothetical protein